MRKDKIIKYRRKVIHKYQSIKYFSLNFHGRLHTTLLKPYAYIMLHCMILHCIILTLLYAISF